MSYITEGGDRPATNGWELGLEKPRGKRGQLYSQFDMHI